MKKIIRNVKYANLSRQNDHVSFGLIGCGNLGKNIMRNALITNTNVSFRVSVKDQKDFDIIWEEFEEYRDRIFCYKRLDYDKIVNGTTSTILAVKDRDVMIVSQMLKSYNISGATIISTIPTVTRDQLVTLFDTHKIARVMPSISNPGYNSLLPIYLGPLYNERIYGHNFSMIEKLFSGKKIQIFEDERKFQLATIYSASLPALYLNMKKDIIIRGINAGLSKEEAEMMVDTAFENAEDLINSHVSTDHICDAIATPGGITASGLQGYRKTGSIRNYFGFAETKLKEAAVNFSQNMVKYLK